MSALTEGTRFKRILFPPGRYYNDCHGNSQSNKSLNSLTCVKLSNRTALNHILAKQGEVCSVINTSGCT